MKIKAALAGILALFAVAAASAQQFPTVPDRTVIGRIGVGGQSGPSQAIPFSNLVPFILGPGTDTSALVGGAVITSTPTVNASFCGLMGALGGGALYTIALGAPSSFPANCVLTFANLDSAREKVLTGFPLSVLPILWPGQTVQIANINSTWVAKINPGKYRPTSPVQFNVSASGSDALGCALGSGNAACATGQYAMNMVCSNVDLSGLNPNTVPSLTIQYADGAYTQNLTQWCDPSPSPWVSSMQAGWLKIAGNINLTGVTLNCGASPCVSPVHSLAGWWFEGFSMTGTAGSLNIDAGTHFYIGKNKFGTTGASSYDLACAYGSLCEFETNSTFTGSKNQFIVASQSGSRVIFKPVTLTFSGSTYQTFYTAYSGASITAPSTSVTYSGVATVTVGSGCVVASAAGGLDTGGNLAPVTTACGGQTNSLVNPGWAQ